MEIRPVPAPHQDGIRAAAPQGEPSPARPACDLVCATSAGPAERAPVCAAGHARPVPEESRPAPLLIRRVEKTRDRKSTRLNSSHVKISYAVFCLKKKK